MSLKMFKFIDEVIGVLENSKDVLETASDDLSIFFEQLIIEKNEGYLNVNSRVKTKGSLKEKILRNNYYNKYKTPEELLSNLSDLIGIRLECRFVDDEANIYKIIRKYFNKIYDDGLYYNALTPNIRLDLRGKQPQKQKNGFKIYRIDGKYEVNDMSINFELQIKSLVNIFWGEIEHKIIYKNYNYMLGDTFLKDIMGSIKKNLSMIDNQLLIIFNQFNNQNTMNPQIRKNQSEKLLSKIIYDIFSTRMKNSIGFVVDFKKPCDTIMKYIFRTNNVECVEEYVSTITKTISRLNEISKNEIEFDKEIKFEREIEFKDNFSKSIGELLVESINEEFQWNLFFRILFTIEEGNNCEDLENFISFLRNRFYCNEGFLKLPIGFTDDEALNVKECFMNIIADSFNRLDSIDFIYDDNLDKINEAIEKVIDLVNEDIEDFTQWQEKKDIYTKMLSLKILSIFNDKLNIKDIEEFINNLNRKCCKEELSELLFRYLDYMNLLSKVKPEDFLSILNKSV